MQSSPGRFVVIVDSHESMVSMMRLYGLSLSESRDAIARKHFGTDWSASEAIAALGLTPIRAEMRFKLSSLRAPGVVAYLIHRVFCELWCEEGYLSEDEIELAIRGELVPMQDIYPIARALRAERPESHRDTQLERSGWVGFDLRRSYSTGHRSESFAADRF